MPEFQPSRDEQLTEQNLNLGYWWVTNKLRVRKATWIVLAVIDFGLIGYVAFGFADWFFGSGVQERAAIAQLTIPATDYAFFRSQNAPRELSTDSVMVVASRQGSYDALSRISNPNKLWWAEFDFHFETPAGKSAQQHGYVLPLSTQPLVALGQRSDAIPSGGSLVVENLVWRRVNQHVTRPDFATWSNVRQRIEVSDEVFVPPAATDTIPSSRVRFKVTNASAFGYYKVGFIVTLMSGSGIVGVNKVTISELRPGAIRDVEASWFSDLPSVSSIEIVPEVNIFDERNYIAPGT